VIGPLILIFVGSVFLLQNAGYLPPTFWFGLWRLWPVVLVLAGIELLLASRIPWLVLAMFAVVVLVAGAVVINSPMVAAPAPVPTSSSTSVDLGSASQATVNIAFDAGQLNISGIEQPATPTQLATVSYSGPANMAVTPTFSTTGDVGHLDISGGGSGHGDMPFVGSGGSTPRLDLGLNPNVPIASLSIKSGASSSHLDLSALKLNDFDASVGAAQTWIRVPQAGATTLRLSGGASDVTLEIPTGVAARLRFRGGLTTINVDPRFPPAGNNLYQSSDFGSNPNSADITIDAGLTRIQVN
jgi:hypothetical protein